MPLQELDWPTIISGTGVFITTCVVTFKGYKDRKKEIAETEPPTRTQIVAGVIQDNSSIRDNTEALRDLTVELRRHNDLLILTSLTHNKG